MEGRGKGKRFCQSALAFVKGRSEWMTVVEQRIGVLIEGGHEEKFKVFLALFMVGLRS